MKSSPDFIPTNHTCSRRIPVVKRASLGASVLVIAGLSTVLWVGIILLAVEAIK